MKLTKLIALLLALVTVLSCFAACGNTEDEDDDDDEKKDVKDEVVADLDGLAGAIENISNGKKYYATVDIEFLIEEDGSETVILAKDDLMVEDYLENLTVLTAAKKVLDEYEVPYELTADGTNISGIRGYNEIIDPENDEAFFWDFKINGNAPAVSSAKEEKIYEDDKITFVYTRIYDAPFPPLGHADDEYVVPRMIFKDDFENEILDKITHENNRNYISAFYKLYDANDVNIPLVNRYYILLGLPKSAEAPIYLCEYEISTKELKMLDEIIRTYCPDYTIEDRDADHVECGYVKSGIDTGADASRPAEIVSSSDLQALFDNMVVEKPLH